MKGCTVVVPSSLRKTMLQIIHEDPLGMDKCKIRVRKSIFWPGINKQIEDLISKCEICIRNRRAQEKDPLISHPVEDLPWKKVGIDLFALYGENYLIIVDYFSKFPEIAHLTDTKTETVIRKLISVFARYGIPQIIMSDNGPQFNNYMFKMFEKNWNFKQITLSPLHPRSNGLVERNVQTIKNLIKKARQGDENPFLTLLNFRSPKIDGVESPAALLFGRDITTKLPYTNSYLKPRKINIGKVQNRWRERQIVQKGYHDRGSKEHFYLNTGRNGWIPTTIRDFADTQRLYFVESPHGEVIRRNSKDLYSPRAVQFQPEATPGPSQPDTSLQPPEIECSDPEKPTEVRTRYGRLVKTPNRLIN
ncbi:K02A2.6-like [Cordylochernes scorpioides]|uniref:RNA-directed DNA polymerase n=1 Tax=Cordylochernes scorpioides TaxID=51811 RepID=A0ABY6KUR4_9ARAC|nr:K02A2.6-like [Cordylochernes scorpioides]